MTTIEIDGPASEADIAYCLDLIDEIKEKLEKF